MVISKMLKMAGPRKIRSRKQGREEKMQFTIKLHETKLNYKRTSKSRLELKCRPWKPLPVHYSLLKTGWLPAQWAPSSGGLTISIPDEKYIIFVLLLTSKKKQKKRPKRNSPKIIWRLKNVCIACLPYSLHVILNTNVIPIFLGLWKREYSSLLSKYRKKCHFQIKHLTGNWKVIYLHLSCNLQHNVVHKIILTL